MRQHIHAVQQAIHRFRLNDDLALLGGDETILQCVGDFHGGIEVDNTRRALQRMGGAHHGRQPFCIAGILLKAQQALV